MLTPGDERFVAVTSNVFAVMGLASPFFALRGIMEMFRYLKAGVSVILFFIGAKMSLGFVPAVEAFFKHHSWVSLAVVVTTLAASIGLSMIITGESGGRPRRRKRSMTAQDLPPALMTISWQQLVMMAVGLTLIYLAIAKKYRAHAAPADGVRHAAGERAARPPSDRTAR